MERRILLRPLHRHSLPLPGFARRVDPAQSHIKLNGRMLVYDATKPARIGDPERAARL
jgi:hypothetical protein